MSLPEPYYADATTSLYVGDCLGVLAAMDADSVDAVVTDPPYGLEFMGREWDAPWKGDKRQPGDATYGAGPGPFERAKVRHGYGESWGQAFQAWCEQWAAECLRVLKPGGHLLAFGGSRTYHRLAAGVEDAGFEVRDQLQWLYGSGFPKSLDVSKAIDKAAGAEREVVGQYRVSSDATKRFGAEVGGEGASTDVDVTAPATPDAQRRDGWGTALKPAHEPVVMARKPLAGTVAGNVLTWGTGAVNIDGCRIGAGGHLAWSQPRNMGYHGGTDNGGEATEAESGRWPANVVLDEDAAAMLDQQSGERAAGGAVSGREPSRPFRTCYGEMDGRPEWEPYTDTGGASRFFYVAKASRTERDASNHHPTVKPVALMRWLIRLVTPPDGVVVDPFAGSGTTGVAAAIESKRCVLIERESEYADIVVRRLSKPIEPTLDGLGGAA